MKKRPASKPSGTTKSTRSRHWNLEEADPQVEMHPWMFDSGPPESQALDQGDTLCHLGLVCIGMP